MLIELILFLLLGILAGTITGLIPGIHINLIGTLLLSSILLFTIQTPYAIIFITAMAITHTFLDFIPSIFLGCSDTDTELSLLPGHKMVQKGKGYEAILLTPYGSLIAIFLILIVAFPSLFIIEKIFPYIKEAIPYFLILISIFLISTEGNKLIALKIFLLTGFLGLSVSTLEITQPLLPLLTGLFGSSIIIKSIKEKTLIPKQILTKPKIRRKRKLILASLLSAPLCSFLPGLGSGQAALIGNLISKENTRGFLTLLGITNTLVMGFSFIALFAIQKTRTGAAAFVMEIVPSLGSEYFVLILVVILISGIVGFYLTRFLGLWFVRVIEKINYEKVSYGVLVGLVLVVLLVSGFGGLLVFCLSTATGLYCLKFKVRRTNMMGVLMVPSIVWGLF